MKNQWLTINQLDKQLKEWQSLTSKYRKPRAGWTKTLRVALSMTAEQLGNRMGVKSGRISQLEKAEAEDAVTLHTLRKVADALDCELVYAIVPKNRQVLADILKKRAEAVANERINTIAHTMALEAQPLKKEVLLEQKKELTRQLTENFNKSLWDNNKIEIKRKI